jgi:hypothetical protein
MMLVKLFNVINEYIDDNEHLWFVSVTVTAVYLRTFALDYPQWISSEWDKYFKELKMMFQELSFSFIHSIDKGA